MNTPSKQGSEFPSVGHELWHVYDLIEAAVAAKEPVEEIMVARFELLLESCGLDDGSIVLQEHWALLHEVKGDFEKAIFHRNRQVQLVDEALAMSGPVGPINNKYLAAALRSLADSLIKTGKSEEADQARKRAEGL